MLFGTSGGLRKRDIPWDSTSGALRFIGRGAVISILVVVYFLDDFADFRAGAVDGMLGVLLGHICMKPAAARAVRVLADMYGIRTTSALPLLRFQLSRPVAATGLALAAALVAPAALGVAIRYALLLVGLRWPWIGNMGSPVVLSVCSGYLTYHETRARWYDGLPG